MKTYTIIFVVLFLLAGTSSATENDIKKKCETAISNKFATWKRASITSEVSEWSKSSGQNPTEVYGDFNGDTYQDLALLIQVGPKPKDDYPERLDSLYIAICLNSPPKVTLHLIEKPYCGDLIALSPKGKKYYNFDTGKTGRYRLDGVAAVCLEKAGATYIYTGKKFIKIVDSD